ncbi:MAG TPA: O-antigen ligase family protein [Vicinamibacterales bacterium]|nr:O-antigen ligase family protein [Vicinamibacterales bacterium]
MTERLVFGYGTERHVGQTPDPPSLRPGEQGPAPTPETPRPAGKRERRDWAFTGLLAFTAALYFRPQDQIPGFAWVPFAEISAIIGLAAMAYGRVTRGLSLTRLTPELIGIAALGFVILLTAPFSIWPGGAVGTFTNVFVKVLLIYMLMVNTLTSPDRLHRFMRLVMLVTGYIATRAMFDYLRGINLIENGRVQGAIGGMFQNPNDLALNMVAVLPLSVLVAIRSKTTAGKLGAAFLGCMMIGAVTATHSRGGFVGLAVMVLILGVQLARRQPAAAGAGALVILLALPFTPSSYWERVSSITDSSLDASGSREARRILLREAWRTFLHFPLYGVGAAQFPNYNPPGRVETWRETHNVVLQVASELGVFGLLAFGFLLVRAFAAGRITRRLLRRASGAAPPRWPGAANIRAGQPAVISPDERQYLDAHAGAMMAAVIGWFVCALFASVAYSWTFYYLLALAAAPHTILADRLAQHAPARRTTATRLAEVRV